MSVCVCMRVRLYGFRSYKLLGGKNCLFYAITEEEDEEKFSMYSSEQLKKDFEVAFMMAWEDAKIY